MRDLDLALDLLAKLVAIPSVSDQSNVPVIDLIAEYLSAHGVGINRVDYAPGKQNLIAAIGPTDAPPLILSGHTDVVPVAGQNWETDPFRLTKRDGAYYGRGSADMKGFLAICLALVPRWIAGDLARPVLLVFSCDEEIGCRGVMPAIDRLVSDYPAPLGAIIGEPTSLQVITREKGNVTLETEVTGVAAHSANPKDGSNAIIAAAHFIRGLSDLSDELATRTDPGFDPDHTTLNVGMIDGGIQKNIVPDRCVIRWEIRPVPGPDRDEVIARADALAQTITEALADTQPNLAIQTRIYNEVPSLSARGQDPILPIVMHAAGRNTTASVSFASEAGHFQAAGFPAVLCGPGRISVAHKADEHITHQELVDGLAFLERLTCKSAIN